MEKRQRDIQEELSTEKESLTSSDRELCKSFFGYSGVKNGRGKTKRKEEACLFVKNCLFPEEKEEEESLDVDKLVDYAEKFPSIFPTDKKEVMRFLSKDGLGLSDREECAILRAMQVREKRERERKLNNQHLLIY